MSATAAYIPYFTYSDQQPALADFSQRPGKFVASGPCHMARLTYLALYQELHTEVDPVRRGGLLNQVKELVTQFGRSPK